MSRSVPELDYVKRDGDLVRILDLDTAAYLHWKGLLDLTVERRPRKSVFIFHDPEHLAERLAWEYVHSSYHDFADRIRRLKGVVHRFGAGSQ